MATPRRLGTLGRMRMSGTPVVLGTLIVLLVVYLVTGFAVSFVGGGAALYDQLVLSTGKVVDGQVWRLLTYGLLHSLVSPFHLLVNGLLLWFFARDLELRIGSWRLLAFFVASLLVGGLFVVAAGLLGIGTGAALGFSAACEASIVAWALFNKNTPVLLFFAVPLRGIHMLAFALLMWLLDAVSVSDTSAAAHLGGIVTGLVTWFFMARRNRLRLFWDELMVKLRLRRGPKLTVVPRKDDWVN